MSRESIKVVLKDGRKVNVGSREQAEAYLENVTEPYDIIVQKTGIIAGTKEEVAEELTRLSGTYKINDFVIFTPIKNAEEKQLSYQLLSDAVLAAKR